MISGKLMLLIAMGFVSVTMAVSTIQSWETNPELEKKNTELNAKTNSLVDTCFSTLENDEGTLASCDRDLKQLQESVCDTYHEADICNDGRVEQYYQTR
jgi:hypothetical protein